MVTIFKNGRRNIHVLISQFLIHVEKQKCWCLNIHFLGQGLQKKTITNTQIQYLTIVAVIFSKMAARIYVFYYLSF